MIFPGTEVRLTSWQFPGSPLLPFLKMGTMFPFYQGLHVTAMAFHNIVESDFETASANSLRTL